MVDAPAGDGGADAGASHGSVVECEGIRWHVERMGHGPTLLLVHGTGSSSHSFRELSSLLARDFTVVAPDLPGHGQSRAPRSFTPSPKAMASALGALLVAIHLSPEVAIGHSAGAAVVAQMALDRLIDPMLLVGLGAALVPFEGIARAVLPSTARLLSAASRFVPIRIRDTRGVTALLRSTGSRLSDEGVERYRRLSERPEHVAAVLAMMANWDLDPLFARLPALETPFLFLAGARDRAVPISHQRRAASRMLNARVVVVPGAGHLLHEEQPATVARHIREELQGATARGARRSLR